jgi:bifunctional UDP-N-acetylglucosamine pyrophosphorylase / glucosamine-1-phosphate N-acetyltransferase
MPPDTRRVRGKRFRHEAFHPMSSRPLLIVVLAAGKGTRMNSAQPKVLHKIAGRSLLGHVLALAQARKDARLTVVVGPEMEEVAAEARRIAPGTEVCIQKHQRGTADAVLAAREILARHTGDVLVLYADTPLLTPETIDNLLGVLDRQAAVAVLGFEARDPGNYGRLLTESDGTLIAIREAKDASPAELQTRLCNSGVMALRRDDTLDVLDAVKNDNTKGEYYLTDVVEIVRSRGGRTGVIVCPEDEVLGINQRSELAGAEAIWQRRARARVMAEGATLVAPETVWLSHDTTIGRDVTIEPNVFFGPGVTVGDGAEIRANCHIEGAAIGAGARIGPFARLRPGADLGDNVHVGNFVEIKNVRLGNGAKANHLSYLGDGNVGAGANIGAGTIFCNYDGFFKHRTEIGERAFIGSNSALVAPVKIGEGAYVGSGSVITKDVASGALALERSSQEERPAWATKFRTLMAKRKERSD